MPVLPTRMLVDLPNWVGDHVMALPAVDRLLRANAGGVTVLHSRPPMQRLLEEIFPEAAVVSSDRHAFPLASALRVCRGGRRFAVGISFRNAYRAKIFLRCVARRSYGSEGGGARWLLSESFAVDRERHQVFDPNPYLRAIGVEGIDPLWRPPTLQRLRAEGLELLERRLPLDHDRPLVALAPAAASWASKRWPAEHFGSLAKLLIEASCQPLIIVGPGEEWLATAVAMAAGFDIPVVGRDRDVAGVVGVMFHVDVVVCNDSGLMHVAALAGAQVVALFGPTDPRRTGPLGEGHSLLRRDLECSGCHRPECPLGHHDCLRGLAPEEPAMAVMERLQRPARARLRRRR